MLLDGDRVDRVITRVAVLVVLLSEPQKNR
jgi:hypothetical protein